MAELIFAILVVVVAIATVLVAVAFDARRGKRSNVPDSYSYEGVQKKCDDYNASGLVRYEVKVIDGVSNVLRIESDWRPTVDFVGLQGHWYVPYCHVISKETVERWTDSMQAASRAFLLNQALLGTGDKKLA